MGIVGVLLTFDIGNTDFWWHLKAGEFMVRHGIPIHTDPFAWTRSGLPYLATHEWLFEIMLYAAWKYLGIAGIVVLRVLLIGGALLFPVLLCKNRIPVFAPIMAATALSLSHAFSDRPQLFTFLLFSATATLCMAYPNSRRRKYILIALPLLTVLWVNVHGAAALLGICLFGTLIIERALYASVRGDKKIAILRTELLPLILTLFLMSIGLVCNPEGFRTLHYLIGLYADNSVEFISEWQPSTTSVFLSRNGIPALLAVLCIMGFRQSVVMSMLMFGGLLFLGTSAVRHEPLFAIVSLIIISRQISHDTWIAKLRASRFGHPFLTCVSAAGVMALLGIVTWNHMLNANRIDNLAGIGTFAPVAGAAEYVRTKHMPMRVFNNYNAGGELLYHDIPVFLDGRNLDYGYAYINRAINAGTDKASWSALDDEFDFDFAIIAYHLQRELDPLPYVDILDEDPAWQLVYLDDWTAVYGKISAMSPDTLTASALTEIRSKALTHLRIPEEIQASALAKLETDLLRMIAERPDGIYPRLYLSKLYASLSLYGPAQELIDEVMLIRPKNYLIWQEQGLLYLEQDRFAEAGAALERSMAYAGSKGVVIDYEKLATIFEKAGDGNAARKYRNKKQ